MTYCLGKIIEDVVLEPLKKWPELKLKSSLNKRQAKKIEKLSKIMMDPNPKTRPSIEQALSELKNIGPDDISQIDFTPFMTALHENTEKDLAKYGFNANIHKIKECFYDTLVGEDDPSKNSNIKLEKLNIPLKRFLAKKITQIMFSCY